MCHCWKFQSAISEDMHMEQQCQTLKDGHVFLKYLWSKGYHFGSTTVPIARVINKSTLEHRHYVMAIHRHLVALIRRFDKYRRKGIEIIDIMPNLVLLMTDHNASTSIQSIRYKIPPFYLNNTKFILHKNE